MLKKLCIIVVYTALVFLIWAAIVLQPTSHTRTSLAEGSVPQEGTRTIGLLNWGLLVLLWVIGLGVVWTVKRMKRLRERTGKSLT
jgi:hypothetical protein